MDRRFIIKGAVLHAEFAASMRVKTRVSIPQVPVLGIAHTYMVILWEMGIKPASMKSCALPW
jgi:hypothetical protein